MLQAQIGGTDYTEFERNNITSTKNVIEAMRAHQVPYYVQISSSVVESVADDWYTNTKKAQEEIALASGFPLVVLRPTLMFGWFDRKHLGWLSRFMQKVPVFPIPGHGRYLRQPLYVGDFCRVIISSIEHRTQGVYNISGLEEVDYIDIIREINASGVTVLLVEQNAKAALDVADTGYVMETGTISFSGSGKDLLADDRVRKAYLGEH